MADPIKGQKVTANGKDSWWWVPAIETMATPTDAEINSVSGLNISCFLLAEQEGVTSTAEKVRLARLLCETSTSEALGEQTWSLADIQGVFDPQAAVSADSKKAFEKFRAGASGFLVRRQAVKALGNKDAVAGQFVDVFKTDVGIATPGKSTNDAAGIYTFTAPAGLIDQAFNVAVVADA